MKIHSLILTVALSLAAAFAGVLGAQEKTKEVTLKGNITCGRCELGLTKNCASVIVVKEKDKETVYFFDAETNKKYHAEICSEGRPGEVTGVVSTMGDKKFINVTKLKFTK